jgi:hypothetical protein
MVESFIQRIFHQRLLVFLFLVAWIPQPSFPQSREYTLKAGYIEKFTHFIDWPEISKRSDTSTIFSIAVIGENAYGNAIENIFSKVKVKNKKVRITYISSVDDIDNCQLLIISESEKRALDKIVSYTSGKPILTIGETEGYGKKGVIINMFIDHNHIRYEINRTALEKTGLKISSLLLSSAIIIETDE